MSETAQAKATHSPPQQRELPSGWRWVKLGEVSSTISKGTTPTTLGLQYTDAGIPFLRAEDVNGWAIKADKFAFHISNDADEILSRSRLLPGDFLITIAGTLGRVGYVPPEVAHLNCNQAVAFARIDQNKVDAQYLCFACSLEHVIAPLLDQKAGGALQNLNLQQIRCLGIPLPPLSEQRRIAGLLREQMASVEKARAAAQTRLDTVKALPAAFLRQVFPQSGQPLSDGWRWVRLGEVCRDISDGTHFTPTYVSEGVPFLSVKDVREKKLSFTDCRYITKEQHLNFCRRCKPDKGDVLYTKVGTTGIAKAIDIDVEFSIFVSVALLKLQSTIIPNYLEKVLNAPVCRTQAENLTQGMANRNLVLKDLKLIILPIAPLDEQERIAAELSGQMASVENARMAAQEELNTINALPAALLRRAFAGEL